MPDMNSMPSGYQGYQDPNLVNQTFGYAGGLTKGGLRDDTITSPWQGLRMMTDALSGNLMRNRAGQMGQQNRNLDASGQMGAVQPPGGAISQAPLSANPHPQASTTPGSFGTPTPPVAMQGGGQPTPFLQGSIPSSMPGGVPGAPGGMMGGMQPPNPMMQALMSQPPGQGMA